MTIFNHTPFSLKEKKGLFASHDFTFASEEDRKAVIKYADKALSFEIPVLPATLYMEYARNGNRTHYEGPYFARRDALRDLILGTLALGTDRYIDKMIDLVWGICEETSWVIPAHNIAHPYRLAGEALPDAFADDIIEIDLFSAETGALLAWIYHYIKDKLDAVSPIVCKRIEYEIDRRILKPFLRLEMRWMTNFINNWTPWIVSNVLTCAAIFNPEWHTLQMIISISMNYLDRFAMTYGEDGGCNEGASYWTAAVAALFDTVCILHDITGGTLDAFDSPLLCRMCEYFPDVCIDPKEKLFFNFADCPCHVTAERKLLYRMGEKLHSEKLIRFADMYNPSVLYVPSRNMMYRKLMGLHENIPEKATLSGAFSNAAIYPDLQLAVFRRGNYSLAVKGGHNRESHNHNDIGSFILYQGATPVIIDAGVGVYTKDTFSDKRYTIWTMQSSYHNLPEIDGLMQLPGREYRADRFEVSENSVFISYRNAYPHDMKASAVTRQITMGNEITILDHVEGADSVYFHLILAEKPQAIPGGISAGGSEIYFEGDYSVEAIDISYDANLKRDWARDSLYRIRIFSPSGKLTTTIREAL